MRISLWTLLWSILIQLVPLLFAQQTVNCTMSVNTSDPLAVAAMQAACIGASPTVVNPSQLCPCSSMVPDPANVGKTRCKENANTTCACPINTYKLFESHYYVCIMCLSGKFNPSVGMAYFNGVSTNTLLSFCSTCSKFSHYTTNISSNEVSFCVCFAGYETYSCNACKVRPPRTGSATYYWRQNCYYFSSCSALLMTRVEPTFCLAPCLALCPFLADAMA